MGHTTYTDWGTTLACETNTLDDAVVAGAQLLAQRMLWGATGRRFGTAETIDEQYRMPSTGVRCVGPWVRYWGGPTDDHGCCAITLEHQPVRHIDAVRVYGIALDADAYRLERGRLIRLGACFPIVAACDEPAIEVDYTWGLPLDADALLAHGELTCEILAGLNGDECRVNQYTINLARQGVTEQFAETAVMLDNGLVGTPIADAWIRTVNPSRLRERSRVYSPDMPRPA